MLKILDTGLQKIVKVYNFCGKFFFLSYNLSMNKATKNFVFYIFMFFIIILMTTGVFFGYKVFFHKDVDSDIDIEIDDKFNEIFDSNPDKEDDVERVEYESENCAAGNLSVEHGNTSRFYSRSFVGVYESCDDFLEIKRCSDGQWIGGDRFQYSSCERTLKCKTEKGTVVENGNSIELFSKNKVLFGDNCERYKKERKCVETRFTGADEYKYEECLISEKGICIVKEEDGEIKKIPNKTSRLFFSKKSVSYNDNCQKYSKNIFCSDGVLSGSENFSFLYCKKESAKNCYISGLEILHGQSRVLYSKAKAVNNKTCGFFAEIRECQDGKLSGKEEYTKAECVE